MINQIHNFFGSVFVWIKKIAPVFGVILALVLVALFLNLLYGSKIPWNIFRGNASPAPQGILLFEKSNCDDCTKVDDFIVSDDVAKSVPFTRLEVVENGANANILADKAQMCGLAPGLIGVPFLWDGKNCILGYVDVINFFKSRNAKVK